MNALPRNSGALRRIDEEAARWFARRDAGLDAAGNAALRQWLASDPRHSTAWRRLEAADAALGRLGAVQPPLPLEDDPELRPARGHLRRLRLEWIGGLAAAAGITLAVVWWRAPRETPAPALGTVATAIGQVRAHPLPDGSLVHLNTDTELAVRFTPGERRVDLRRGEAHFTVAKDAARPFVVSGAGVRVVAVGTAFSVRLRAEAVEVLVTEGRVGLREAAGDRSLLPADSGQPAPVLAAGQRASISVAAAAPTAAVVAPVEAPEIARQLAWQARRLEFSPTSLATIAEEFNRYSRVRLVVADPSLATLRLGGSFAIDDWSTLVRLLESDFAVAVERRGDEVFLRRREK